MWVKATKVSKQALSQRLNSLPATLFAKLFEQVIERLAVKRSVRELAPAWSSVAQRFTAIWIGDASTLEAMKKHFGQLQEKTGTVLAGKILMVVEAFTHTPVAIWYDADAKINETRWWQALLERLPDGGLLIVDMGFYGFEWFDSLTAAGKYVLTRQKNLVTYRVTRVLVSRLSLQRRNYSHGIESHSPLPPSHAPSISIVG